MDHYTKTLAQRAQPSEEWMLSLQQRFPVERSINEIFIRKLRNRHVKVEHSMNFENLHETLTQFIKVKTGQSDLFIENLQRLSGGASKEQFTFDLIRKSDNSDAPTTQRLMLRMDPTESVVETHRLREWQMLRAMQGEVPVPEVFWLDLEGEYLGQPAIVAGFLEGTVRPESKEDKMSGIGMYFEPYLRENLKGQFVEILAKIHRVNWREKDLSAFDVPQLNSTQANEWALNQLERAWQEDTTHAHPIMEQAAVWLRENTPVVENPVIIHGDYRSGNFMYDNNLNINAIFDWELAYLGDYHDDVAWASLSIFGGPDEQGNLLAGSLMPIEEFLERYEAASGFPVDRKKLFYYQVFSYYKMAVFTAATTLRVVYSRKTHLDAMMNFASGIGYICISELNRMLEQA